MVIDIPVPNITYTTTYIKFGSAPTSVSDYDACASAGSGLSGATSYSNQTSVWVWGNGFKGQIIINNDMYLGGISWSAAVEIQLTGNYNIALGYGNGGSGGTTN